MTAGLEYCRDGHFPVIFSLNRLSWRFPHFHPHLLLAASGWPRLYLPGHRHSWDGGSLGSGLKCSDTAHLQSDWKTREYFFRHISLFSLLPLCPGGCVCGTKLRARGHRSQLYCPCTPASWVGRRVEKAHSSSGGTSGRYAAHLCLS